MPAKKSMRRVDEAYKRRLQSWAEEERRKTGLSYRDFAELVVKKTGIKISYGSLQNWLKATLKTEITENGLRAVSRYRGDKTVEQTRKWLWGGDLPQPDEELGKVINWIREAKPEHVAIAVKAGADALAKFTLRIEPKIPPLTLKMEQAGISVESLLDECVLDENELELVRLYLIGQIPSISDRLKDEVQFSLDELITSQSSPKTYVDNLLSRE